MCVITISKVHAVDIETPKELVAQDQLSQLLERQFQNREELFNAIQSICLEARLCNIY